MKLIYLTTQKYPSSKVDPFYWRSMAESFSRILGKNFFFVVRKKVSHDIEIKRIQTISINAPNKLRFLFYGFFLPFIISKNNWNKSEAIFFTADSYLLSILVFWRKVLRLKYRICSDWHHLFEDWRDRFIAQNSDFLVSTSNHLKNFIVSKCRVAPEKIFVAYGGMDASLFEEKSKLTKESLRKKLLLPEDKFLVGYVGGFRSVGLEKGIDTMIKALQHVSRETCMVFVGGGSKHIEEYRNLARSLGVEAHCIFIEKKSLPEVVEYELAMDVLVIPYPNHPHFRDYGFPMKVWEYLASGRPIIYSNLEIIAEVLHGRGLSFRPGDPEDLARVISSPLPSGKKELHTWEKRASGIVDFISK